MIPISHIDFKTSQLKINFGSDYLQQYESLYPIRFEGHKLELFKSWYIKQESTKLLQLITKIDDNVHIMDITKLSVLSNKYKSELLTIHCGPILNRHFVPNTNIDNVHNVDNDNKQTE